ncbi:MAG: response regulator [Planctomycetota bacterium]|jgi:two-component system chemotaxis response regulator CheY
MALNVLVVDDSTVARMMILKTLRLCGIPLGEVHEAANGQEGLEALDTHWVDLMFMDINMPVMDGEEMIQRVRSIPEMQDLPIVVVSTEGSKTRIDRLLAHRVKFIHKPFTPEIVGQVVQQITGVRHDQPA